MTEIMREADIDSALAKMEKLGHDQSGWDTLYRDPTTGKFWEIVHPENQLHGGGPRQLTEIASSVASIKYPAGFPRQT
jgi:Immunity protein 27